MRNKSPFERRGLFPEGHGHPRVPRMIFRNQARDSPFRRLHTGNDARDDHARQPAGARPAVARSAPEDGSSGRVLILEQCAAVVVLCVRRTRRAVCAPPASGLRAPCVRHPRSARLLRPAHPRSARLLPRFPRLCPEATRLASKMGSGNFPEVNFGPRTSGPEVHPCLGIQSRPRRRSRDTKPAEEEEEFIRIQRIP